MRIFLVRFLFLLSLGFLPCLSAYATSIPAGTYSLTGVAVNGSALTGTITLDSSGLATAANITFANASYGNPTFSVINSKGTSGNNPVADFAYIASATSSGQIALYYVATLNNSGGITLCEPGTGCAQASYLQMYSPNLQANLSGGSLTAGASAIAATPEPSSWMLLVTGILMMGSVLLVRRSRILQPSSV